MFNGCFRVSEEIGRGNAGRKTWISSAHCKKDADYNARKLLLSATVQWGWKDRTYREICCAFCTQSWQQKPWLQEFPLQDHRSECALSASYVFCFLFVRIFIKKNSDMYFLVTYRLSSLIISEILLTKRFLPRDAMHSADYAVARCLSVHLCICHMPLLCWNG